MNTTDIIWLLAGLVALSLIAGWGWLKLQERNDRRWLEKIDILDTLHETHQLLKEAADRLEK